MSGVNALIDELRRLGVRLWLEDGRLRYQAPKGVLTPELLARLREHKDEIAGFFAAAAVAVRRAEHAGVPIGRAAEGPAPLSFAQESIWFLHQLDGDTGPGAAYNVPAAVRLQGPLDVNALERSLTEIVRRHAILRSRFEQTGDGAVQLPAPGDLALELTDLSTCPASERERLLQRRLSEEAGRTLRLDAAPPVRFSLIRLDDAEHVLVAVLHHLVTDGWSMGVLFRELSALYGAVASGEPSPLPDLQLQYADYARHQRRTLTRESMARDLEYWKAQLDGAPPAIELPADRPRPAEQSYRGGLVRFEIGASHTAALKRLAQAHDVSLFMVLLAAYAAVLARHASQDDVVVGTPVANRDRREVEGLIGVFSNYIPLRVDLSGDPSVADLLQRVKRMTLDGYAHQHVPFERLVDAARPERRLGLAPLFQVALVLQNLPSAPLALKNLKVTQLPIDRDTAKLDVSVLLEESGGALRGELEYCRDLFEQASAARLATHLVRTLEGFTATPGARVWSIALDSAEERHGLVQRWSGASSIEPVHAVVHERFHAQAERTPDAIAVVGGDERLTYRELATRVSRLARHLVTLGVRRDDRVAVCLPRSADAIVALLASLEAGGAYVPLDPAHPTERLGSIVADAGARVLITTSALADRVPGARTVVMLDRDAEAIASMRTACRAVEASPSQLAYVIYTSGSTGTPKGVMVEHRAVCSLVHALERAVYRRHGAAVRVALVASTVFDASVQQIFGALLLGHALHVVDDDARQSGERLLAFLEAHRIELTDGTPSLLALLLDAGLGRREGLALTHLLIGGEALPSRLVQQLHAQDAAHRLVVTNVYGPTECGVDDTFRDVEPGEPLPRAFVPIGRPLSNARVLILDAGDRPCPVGVPGDIWIGGPCLGRGYLGQPALTASAYRPDPFTAGERLYRSGDRGRWTGDGEIEYLGRADDQVKVRGYRVELAEIEAVLRRHPQVKDAVVSVDRSDPDHARIIGYVIPGDAMLTVASLRERLTALLPHYMVPSAFALLDRFPLNASGKVDRARMPRVADLAEVEQGASYVAPRDDRERALADAWHAVLGRDRVGAEDHFFALGGDSIKALQVVSRLRQGGWKLELRDLFASPTVSSLAPLLQATAAPALPAPPDSGQVPLGPVQAAFFRAHAGPKHHFHQSLLLACEEAVDVPALTRALEALVAHHPALRVSFRESDGRWMQECGSARDLPVEVVDLRASPAPWDALGAHATARMAQTDLSSAPLLAAVLYRWPGTERLLLAAHHLIVDGVSWRILIKDLDTAYAQAREGTAVALPPGTDAYARWTAGMHDVAASLPEADRRYWADIDGAAAEAWPVDDPARRAMHGDRAEVRVTVAAPVTALLLTGAHEAYGTRVDDLLLTALGRALSQTGAAAAWKVLLEGHGREPLWDGVDTGRTVGWFTARYPVVIDIGGSAEPGQQIKQVKEMLRRVPHGGSSYEAAHHLAGAAHEPPPLPQVAFNYLGQLGRDLRAGRWRWTDEAAGAVVAPGAALAHDLEILAFVRDGELHVVIGYGATRVTRARMERLAAAFRQAIEDVVAHAAAQQGRELTPSDIDYDGFSIEQLDEFMKNL